MKKIKVVFLLLFVLISFNSFGDIIAIERQDYVQVRIDNLNDFPRIILIGINKSAINSTPSKAFMIHQGVDFQLEKYCSLNIYVTEVEYLKRVGTKKFKFNNDKNVRRINQTFKLEEVNPYIHNSVIKYYSLIKEKQEYKLVESKTIFRFKDGRPDVVEKYK